MVKKTPSGVGFGVAVTAVCGEPATPVNSWMRMSRAKSSCIGVVAVVDVGAAVLAKLHLELHAPSRPQAPDVLAHEVLGGRKGGTTAVHGDAFLEVEVDRVIPAAAAVNVGPVLDLAGLRVDHRHAVGVHRVGSLAVDGDGPGEAEHHFGAIGRALSRARIARVAVTFSAEFDDARAHRCDDRDLLCKGWWHHALVITTTAVRGGEGAARHVYAWHRANNPELQHGTKDRVAFVTAQGVRQRHPTIGLVAARLFQDVDEVELVADSEPREVDDDVVALGDALFVEFSQGDRMHHEVAVVGDKLEWHDTAGGTGNDELEKRDMHAFRMRKRYLSGRTSMNGA